MRLLGPRELSIAAGVATMLFIALGGCQDATQVTLVIELRSDITCTDVSATAITVGAESAVVEERVARAEFTTKTSACDAASRRIGTLVITPSSRGRGAVAVVVGYRGTSPEVCKPPKYEGCIVARRRFSFADHTSLSMPITIDPACAGVECAVDDTCREGRCFASEVILDRCAGGVCEEPGARPTREEDGGGSLPLDASPPAPPGDSGTTGSGGSGPPEGTTGPWCNPLLPRLWCPGPDGTSQACGSGEGTCCDMPGGGVRCTAGVSCAGSEKYCCSANDCAGRPCLKAVQGTERAGQCAPAPTYSCDTETNQLLCPLDACKGPGEHCCRTANADGECATGTTCLVRLCCTNADCDGGPCELGPEVPGRKYCTGI